MIKAPLFIGLALALMCGPALSDDDLPVWKADVVIHDSEFDRSILILGPENSEETTGYPSKAWKISTTVSKVNGEVKHHLLFTDSYIGDWKFWMVADTDRAEPLTVSVLERKTSRCYTGARCDHLEIVEADIDDALMQRAAQGVLKIRFSSREGDTFVVTPDVAQSMNQIRAAEHYSKQFAPQPTPPAKKEKRTSRVAL